MGKTRDLFKKPRGMKETFHAKMGTVQDRYGMDLTEAEDIKKRWQHQQTNGQGSCGTYTPWTITQLLKRILLNQF